MRFKNLIFIIVMVLIAGCASQQSMYKKAVNTNTVDSYEKFLSKYPDSQLADSTKIKLEKLEYEKTIKMATLMSYENFINKYPNSKYISEINGKLAELKLNNIENLTFNEGISLLIDYLKIEKSATSTQNERIRNILDELSSKYERSKKEKKPDDRRITDETFVKISFLNTFFKEKQFYENIVSSEILFSIYNEKQRDIFIELYNSGKIMQKFDWYKSTMKEFDKNKTFQIIKVLNCLKKSTDIETRLRAWKSIETIIGLLFIKDMKEREEGTYKVTVSSYCMDINITYSELKNALLAAKKTSKNEKESKVAQQVISLIE